MCQRPSPRIALALTLLAASLSWAQEAQTTPLPGFELEQFEANPGRGVGLLSSGETLPAGGLRLMMLGNYGHRPLLLRNQGEQLAIVSDRVVGLLSGAYGVFSWLEVGAQLPVVLWQRGQDLDALGLSAPASQGLGTPRLHARVGLLSQRSEQPVDLAVDLGLGLPLGSTRALGRDPGLRFRAQVAVGGQLGWVRPALVAGVLLHPLVPLGADASAAQMGGPEVHVGAALGTLTGTSLNGELSVRATFPSSSNLASVETLGGLRYQLRSGLEIFGLGGPGLGATPGTPRFRLLFGLSYSVEPPPKFMFLEEAPPPPLRLAEAPTQGPVEAPGKKIRPVKTWELNTHTLAQEEPPAEMPFQPGPRDRILLRGTVLFGPSSAELPEAVPLLDRVALLLQEMPESTTVLIEGHSDAEGSYTLNRLLSLQRAQAVQLQLVSRGAPIARLRIQGFGSDWPASTSTTRDGIQLNRRAEILVISQPPTTGSGSELSP